MVFDYSLAGGLRSQVLQLSEYFLGGVLSSLEIIGGVGLSSRLVVIIQT
jgi:hypothetical protein